MLDIRFVRAHPEIVKADLAKRNDTEKIAWVDELLGKDARSRELKVATDTLRKRRNEIGKEINALKKSGGNATALIAEGAALP
ncbi:MAG TPA: serine--tRNA ligase, partial [Methanoregulaceae archaeon]|nr:serine--tRNA ligase [Methanoregulaceae archaeon]